MRILVVEDEERLRVGLVRLIESIDPGYRVVAQASNGIEGLKMIEQFWPDVVFTDIRMPEMDGFEMIDRVAAQKRYKGAFVIISAYSDIEYFRRAIQYHVVDYVLKPITFEDVERVLLRIGNRGSGNPFVQGCVEERYPIPENASPLVRSAIDKIRNGYAGTLALDVVASELGVSSEYFSQLFSKQMSITFTGYLKNYRIEVAKRLLLERRWKIQDIAEMSGYQNSKYFSRVFREVEGLSPSDFLNQYSETVINESKES